MKIQVTSPQVVNQAASADVIPHLLSHNPRMPSLCNSGSPCTDKEMGKVLEGFPRIPLQYDRSA